MVIIANDFCHRYFCLEIEGPILSDLTVYLNCGAGCQKMPYSMSVAPRGGMVVGTEHQCWVEGLLEFLQH